MYLLGVGTITPLGHHLEGIGVHDGPARELRINILVEHVDAEDVVASSSGEKEVQPSAVLDQLTKDLTSPYALRSAVSQRMAGKI